MIQIKYSAYATLIGVGLFMTSCFAQPTGMVKSKSYDRTLATMLNAEEVPFISVEELVNIKSDSILLLDTRSREEYEVSHIPGALWIGYDDFDRDRVKNLDPKKQVIVYCSVGYRSEKIGQQLQEQGFKEIRNLYGSIFEWANRSQALVNPQGDTVYQIHAYNKVWGRWINNENLEKKY